MHEVENPEGGVSQIFAKINVWGVHAFWSKISRRYTILCFIAFLLTHFLKIYLRGPISYPPYTPMPLCASKILRKCLLPHILPVPMYGYFFIVRFIFLIFLIDSSKLGNKVCHFIFYYKDTWACQKQNFKVIDNYGNWCKYFFQMI